MMHSFSAGLSSKSGAAYISEEDQKLLGKAMLSEGVQDQKEKELVLKEIQARREQEKRKVQLEISENMRKLNDQRFELMEESEKLLKKKAQHYELQKKGVEFLASVEQGLAPPMEFIMKNIGEGVEDQYRSEATIEDIVARAKKFTKIGESRIQFMKAEHKEYYGYDPYDKPYRGELKPLIQRMNPENVYISRLIIDWLMELVIRKHLENQNELAATREKQHYLQEKAKRLQKKVDTMAYAQCYIEIRDKILNNVIDKLIREAAFEIATVNQMAKTISLNLIVRAIKGGRNSGNSEGQLSKIFYSLRNPDMTKKNDPNFRFNYKDMAKIEDPATAAKRKMEKKKTKVGTSAADDDQDDKKKQGADDHEEDDQTVLQMYPEIDCVEFLGAPEILKLELDYWKNIQLNEVGFIAHNAKKKYTVSALAISFNKELIAVGFSNGSVSVFSTMAFPAVQIAQVEEVMAKRIVHMEFALDNMSQLLVVDEDGNFTVNFNAYNLKSPASMKSVAENVLIMKPYYSFNWKMLTRSGKVNTQDANRIAFACFHPGITFTGLQPTVMIGSEQGLLLKFNSNKDLYKGIMYKFPIHNIINTVIMTNQDAEFPNEHNKTLVVTDNHKEGSEKHINIFREFFVEHRSKILAVVFLNKPETFLTVDQKGYIYYWVYEKDQYLVKIDGYQPKAKYKISSGVMTYVPKTSQNEFGEANSMKIDFNQGGLSRDEGGAKYYKQIISDNKEYDKDLVNLRYNTSENLQHIADIIVTKEQFPTESGQEVTFYKGRVNQREEKFESLSEDKYISQLVEGQVEKCHAITGNQFIVIQQILPHKVDQDRAYVQFVRFDTGLFRLKKVRIKIESPDVDDIDFTVLEDFGPFGTPYIFVLMRQGLFVASLATGQVMLDFKRHLSLIQAEAKLAQLATANYIKHVIDDTNTEDMQRDAFQFQAEYRRLYAI